MIYRLICEFVSKYIPMHNQINQIEIRKVENKVRQKQRNTSQDEMS